MYKAHKENGSGTKAVRWDPSRDASISFHAKGILYYLLLKPERWVGQVFDITDNNKDSAYMIRKGVKELVDAGYMHRVSKKVDGKFAGSYYEFSDRPIFKK